MDCFASLAMTLTELDGNRVVLSLLACEIVAYEI
jgi:hypothetical protein